jgi:hypothetical protein
MFNQDFAVPADAMSEEQMGNLKLITNGVQKSRGKARLAPTLKLRG